LESDHQAWVYDLGLKVIHGLGRGLEVGVLQELPHLVAVELGTSFPKSSLRSMSRPVEHRPGARLPPPLRKMAKNAQPKSTTAVRIRTNRPGLLRLFG
jgi:hypothetical protein